MVAATRLVVVVVVTEAGGMGLVLVIVTAVVDTVGVDIAAVESQPLHVLSHLSPTTSHKPCVKICQRIEAQHYVLRGMPFLALISVH